jgi:hypothetical protein
MSQLIPRDVTVALFCKTAVPAWIRSSVMTAEIVKNVLGA